MKAPSYAQQFLSTPKPFTDSETVDPAFSYSSAEAKGVGEAKTKLTTRWLSG
jgi:hypothetical protein